MALTFQVGTAYNYATADAVGDAAGVPAPKDPYGDPGGTWQGITGTVPGMTVSPGLTGTPTTAGAYTVTLSAPGGTDPYGDPLPNQTAVVDVTVEAAPAPEPTPETTDPLVASVLAFLGIPESSELVRLAAQHVRVVTSFVRGYTRGRGFYFAGDGPPFDDVADVIVSAAARYVVNPQQLTRQALGNQVASYASLEGFTLAEKAVLHNYRRRAA